VGDKGIGISDYQVAGEQKIRVSGGRGQRAEDSIEIPISKSEIRNKFE